MVIKNFSNSDIFYLLHSGFLVRTFSDSCVFLGFDELKQLYFLYNFSNGEKSYFDSLFTFTDLFNMYIGFPFDSVDVIRF